MGIEDYLCFPQSFAEGRDWFRDAVTEAGGALDAAINPHGLTPEGDPLSTEVGWFGKPDARRLFVSISGTHGQEYFSGAAGQLDWILKGGPARLAPEIAVCLVHAHNPYGAAWLSRGNEHFVDLNRNYRDHDEPLRPNPLYPELFDILFTHEMDEHVLDEVMAKYYDFVARHDPVEAMTAMGGGQCSHPSGTLYCGDEAEWSTQNLRMIASSLLDRAEKVAIIDWHTGLGDFGKATMLHNFPAESPEADRAGTMWAGAERNAELADSAQPQIVGNVCHGVADDLRRRGAQVVETVTELGTFANKGVLAALLIDRWLRFECPDRDAPHAVVLRTKMLERLNPSNPEWREAVLKEMARIYARTIDGLATWR